MRMVWSLRRKKSKTALSPWQSQISKGQENLCFSEFSILGFLTHVLPVMKAKHSEVTYECEKGEVWVGGCVHSADSTRYPRQQAL